VTHIFFRLEGQSTGHHSTGRFISDDAQSVSAFTAEPVDQLPRILMRQAAGFATTITQD
jgi:hypothetical protein